MKLTELQALAGKAAAFFDHCVIGGGAPRDAFCGGPIKDIDLFVDVRGIPELIWAPKVQRLADAVGGTLKVHHEGSVEGHYATYHITWDGPVIEVLPVERCVFSDIHDYDFGLSQVQMTQHGLIHTARFVRDMQDHTLTYTKDKVCSKSADRLRRLRRKYPDRTPVNCFTLHGA